MNIQRKHLILLLFFTLSYSVSGHDDSTLYVKTKYQHEIYNGRNTARKFAVKQEMRNSDRELFREVYYNKNTKQVDYVLYYFYNQNNSIRLIEKVNQKEKIIEYYKYKYKKEKVSFIKHYTYNKQNSVSTLQSTKKYSYKKNTISFKEYNSKKELIKTVKNTSQNNIVTFSEIINHRADSAYKKIEYTNLSDTIILNKTEFVISGNQDTLSFFHEYIYNVDGKLDKIDTYKHPDKEKLIYYTLFKYFPGGNIQNIRSIADNNYYLENITYKLQIFYRDLPTREPIF